MTVYLRDGTIMNLSGEVQPLQADVGDDGGYALVVSASAPAAIKILEHTTTAAGTGADGEVDIQETTEAINGEIIAVQVNLVNCPSGTTFKLRDSLLIDTSLNPSAMAEIIKMSGWPAHLAAYAKTITYPTRPVNYASVDSFEYNYTGLYARGLHPIAGTLQIDLQNVNSDSTVTVKIWYR